MSQRLPSDLAKASLLARAPREQTGRRTRERYAHLAPEVVNETVRLLDAPSTEWVSAHAALFGVNPWRLQSWRGHKRIDETMIYVHVAETHRRDIPDPVLEAGDAKRDPDRQILAMLGARGAKRRGHEPEF